MESKLTGCCTFTKFVFIFFNIVFFLIGVAALGVGIWAQVSETFTKELNNILLDSFKLDQTTINEVVKPETVDNAAILIIVGGAIVMVIGFLGCFGAMRESQCLLVSFFISLFLILGVIVAGAILVLAFPKTVEDSIKPEIEKIFGDWADNGNANQTLDLIQEKLECCGINGPEDFTKDGKAVPASCGGSTIGCVEAFQKKITDLFASNPWIVGGIGIGVLALLVIGMVLSCCLCCAVRKSEPEVY